MTPSTNPEVSNPPRGSPNLAPLVAAAVVGLMLLSSLGVASSLGSRSSSPGAPSVLAAVASAHPGAAARPVAPALPHSFGPPSNGRGTFFTNTPIPFPTTNVSNIYGVPQNNSDDPSLNLTTQGTLAVAYNAWTNSTACANVSAYAQVEIGFSSSTNGGSTWSTPKYLSNTDCSLANQYANAWQPSLTSLSNGTLVLAFVELNTTPFSAPLPYAYFGQYGYWDIAFARLVVTESYNNGTTWNTPTVLNASSNPLMNAQNWIPERPWISAFGHTVYVGWMNYSQAPYQYSSSTTQGSSQVHLLVSQNGGASWGARIDLPDTPAGGALQGMNPYVMTGPTGKLYVAYTTNITYHSSYNCATYCVYGVFTANLMVATSANNGTSFALHDATQGTLATFSGWGSYAGFLYPAPQLSVNPVNGQLYLAYTGGDAFTTCNPACFAQLFPNVYVTNSSNGGLTWSKPHSVSSQLEDPTGFNAYNVAIATSATGVLHLETSWLPIGDPSYCSSTYNCPQFQVYLNSSDNGTTFTDPITIWANSTNTPFLPDGEYDTILAAGPQLFVAWSHETCAISYCNYPTASGYSQVTVSSLYRGVGVTLTYTESGLTSGTPWTINVGGNARLANAPGLLSVSGVPPSTPINWTIGSIPAGYGTRFGATPSIAPPSSFTSSSTIYENFSEQVLVDVSSTPDIPSCALSSVQFCWDSAVSIRINYNITAAPGPNWVNLGATISESVTPNPIYGLCPFCYLTFENLTFLSWTGAGSGSVNTSSPSIKITANGPVNESANFRVVGACTDYLPQTPPLQCTVSNATLVFHERGLPASTTWRVSAWGWGNQTVTNSSSSAWLGITSNVTIGMTYFAVWTIVDGVTGKYWVGSTSPLSPVEVPGVRIVDVNFTAVLPTSASFSATFKAVGLPNGTAWSLGLNGGQYGIESANWTVPVRGGSQSITPSSVYLTGGTSYYPSLVTVEPFVVGASWQNFSSYPSSLTLDGPAIVWVTYSPEYWLSVTNSTGGTAIPGSQWVRSGGSVTLNETPSPGYYFVGWSGSGGGAVTTASPAPRVTLSGPVTELATFSLVPPPRFTVTIQAVGLPPGVTLTVRLGATNYSGGASYLAQGLLAGPYALGLPYAYQNSSQLTRYAPSVASTSFGDAAPGVLNITSNGWLNLSFATQYLLTISATQGGSVSPSPGSSWGDAGAALSITATPDVGEYLAGWNASGPGSVGGTNLTITPTLNGPLWETAQFLAKPVIPPAVYTLTVTESGLPAGVNWSISIGSTGTGAAATTLTLGGLNGSYTVSVATIYDAAGTTRYVPASGAFGQNVTANSSATVTFATQYLLTVSGSSGGTVSSGGWEAKGASVPLTATVSGAAWQFLYWNGSGAGSAGGSSAGITVTMNGPVVETATFSPVYAPATTTGSTTAGESTAFGLLAGMAIAGLVIGLILARRRSPPPVRSWDSGSDPSPPAAPAIEEAPPAESWSEAAPDTAVYDEGVP
ncbi:MAG: hypothetical protein L3K19_08605 [Thermoplasmata archaeon]|nr:hypothetical protein [Thermoplasmata archaeon]